MTVMEVIWFISQLELKEVMSWLKFIEILNLFSTTEKKKENKAAKPDPDADYVGDDEDYGYSEEFEDDDDVDFSADEEDNEPI